MFVITTAAATTDLTTLDSVKLELGITATDEDDYLTAKIDRISSTICSYLNVKPATDGTRSLGRETLVETFRQPMVRFIPRLQRLNLELLLSRYPVTSIASIVVDGTALLTTEYEVDGATGILYRLTTDSVRTFWVGASIVVTYTAGWLLPNDSGNNMPFDIEDAAIGLIKLARAARERDPLVKSENFAGILATTYWTPSPGDDPIPPDIAYKLAPYRNISV